METTTSLPEETTTTMTETTVDYDAITARAAVQTANDVRVLLSVALVLIVVNFLWTVFSKWFFGGV